MDMDYRNKWQDYETIAGENTTPSESPRTVQAEIQSLAHQSFINGVVEELQGCVECNAALELLGYLAD